MEKIVNSPNLDVSKEYILIEQDTVTKLKSAIVRNASNEELQKIIDDGVGKMMNRNKQLAISMRKSLINSTNHWRYTFYSNINTINKSLYLQLLDYQVKKVRTDITTYNVDVANLANDIKKNPFVPIDQFRGYNAEIKNGVPMIKNYNKLVKSQLRLLASEVPKVTEVVVDKQGNQRIRLLPLRNKVEMVIRYESNLQDVASLKSSGVKLVWTSSHASCSPRCSMWQGRLYSLDGTSGKIDGIPYSPLEEALNANGGNSIINGYNCRHYLIEYTPNSKSPKHYTEKQMKKEYSLDQQQRMYENRIRNLKANAEVFKANNDMRTYQAYTSKAKELMKEYEQFSLKNDRAFFRWRCEVNELN